MTRFWPRSLRARLTLWFTLIFTLIVLLSNYIAYRGLMRIVVSQLDGSLFSLASVESESFIEKGKVDQEAMSLKVLASPYFLPEFVQVLAPSGDLISEAGASLPERRIITRAQITEIVAGNPLRLDSLIEGHPVRLVGLRFDAQSQPLVLVAGARTDSLYQTRRLLLFILVFVNIGTVIVSAAGVYLIIGRALRPVQHISDRARQIGGGDLNQRIDSSDTSLEMGRLIQVLNETFGRLARLFDSQRQFIQDASHEIRSPLAAIRCRLEVALRQDRPVDEYKYIIESSLEDVARMTSLAEDLFLLARADSESLSLEFREMPLARVLSEVHEQLTGLAETREINFTFEASGSNIIFGDMVWIQRAFRNIVENALKYTPKGGSVWIRLESEGDYVRTEVQDTGIGIPVDEQQHIFRRFYRIDQARSRNDGGAGLGLAICDQVIKAHHGRIEVTSSPGAGTRFSVFLLSSAALLEESVT